MKVHTSTLQLISRCNLKQVSALAKVPVALHPELLLESDSKVTDVINPSTMRESWSQIATCCGLEDVMPMHSAPACYAEDMRRLRGRHRKKKQADEAGFKNASDKRANTFLCVETLHSRYVHVV
jgi:hypothetical protein